jgi:hypothetical protein
MMLHPSIFLILATFTPAPTQHVECSCICWDVTEEIEHPPPPGDELADWPQPIEAEPEHGPCPPSK